LVALILRLPYSYFGSNSFSGDLEHVLARMELLPWRAHGDECWRHAPLQQARWPREKMNNCARSSRPNHRYTGAT
jgi:hypothetical protein